MRGSTEFHFRMSSAHVLQALCLLMLFSTVSSQQGYMDENGEDWLNTWRQGFNFQCPHGEALVAIKSYFSEKEGSDRRWNFECQRTPYDWGEPSECWWDDINRAGMEWYVCMYVDASVLSNTGLCSSMYMHFNAIVQNTFVSMF